MTGFIIRESRAEDEAAIMALYPMAFPDEELRPLVGELLDGGAEIISLVAHAGDQLAGHVIFTFCSIKNSAAGNGATATALLAPLAVAPAWQKSGCGTAIVRHGLKMLAQQNVAFVFVLGDPAYYGRFGFKPDKAVAPPYPLPPEWRDAWQSVRIHDAGPAGPGALIVPAPWRKEALWR